MSDLLVRKARDADRDAVLDVTLSAYEEYAASLPPPVWEGYRQNIVDTLADSSPAEQLVAEWHGSVVGTVLLYPPGPVSMPDGRSFTRAWPEVRLLAVAPAARRQGVGRALMDAVVRHARQTSQAITLHTNDLLMQPAVRLYERLGFQHAPELDFYPAEGIVIKGYRLNLNATDASTSNPIR